MSECRSCHAAIVWVRTENGKMMPCNIDAKVIKDPDGRVWVRLESHWSSCPDAKKWSQKNKKEEPEDAQKNQPEH